MNTSIINRLSVATLAALVGVLLAVTTGLAFASQAEASSYETREIATPDGEAATALSNGKRAFYTVDNVIYKLNLASRKLSVVKLLPVEAGVTWEVGSVYKNRIFLTKTNRAEHSQRVVSCKINGGKLTKAKEGCRIVQSYYGKYVLCTDQLAPDSDAMPLAVYKIKGGKLKRVGSISQFE